jgi:hypothetical protein
LTSNARGGQKGTLFERVTIAGLGVPFVDLSGIRGDEKEAETRAAIERGDTLIYSGRLSVAELLGEPDLLRKAGAETYAAAARRLLRGEQNLA